MQKQQKMIENKHNTLSPREAVGVAASGNPILPPPSTKKWDNLNSNPSQPLAAPSALPRPIKSRVGRACCIMLSAAALLALASCGKESGNSEEEFNRHHDWADNDSNTFWDKTASSALRLDPMWDGDTILFF